MSCYDDLKERMDIEILRDLNVIINCVDSITNEQMMRKSILKNQLKMANYAAFFGNLGDVKLFPHQIKVIEKLHNVDQKTKIENREKLKNALREDLMNERKR